MTGRLSTNSLTAVTADDVIRLREHLQIVHHIQGRLRVRISTSALGEPGHSQVQGLRRFIESLEGVQRLRISATTRSAIVDYNQKNLSPQLWESLIDGSDDAVRSAFAALTKAA